MTEDFRYYKCSNCGRTLRKEELLTHLEYDQRQMDRAWAPSIGEHSDWWYEKIEPLKLDEGEIIMVCRFCGEIRPVEVEPTPDGKGIADLRMVMNFMEGAEDDEISELKTRKIELEELLNDYAYSAFILNLGNVNEKMDTSSGTFHIYSDGSVRFEDVVRKKGRYYKVPVYQWEKVANEYAEPTSLMELFDEKDGWLVDEDSFGKMDHKKNYGPKINFFQEIDSYILRKRVERLEEDVAELRELLSK